MNPSVFEISENHDIIMIMITFRMLMMKEGIIKNASIIVIMTRKTLPSAKISYDYSTQELLNSSTTDSMDSAARTTMTRTMMVCSFVIKKNYLVMVVVAIAIILVMTIFTAANWLTTALMKATMRQAIHS